MSGLPDRPTPLSQTAFEQSYGSAFICMVIGVCLYGISILQSYIYFMKYPEDSIFIKLLVSSLLVLGTSFTTLSCVDVYHFLVLSYTKPQLLIEGDWYCHVLFDSSFPPARHSPIGQKNVENHSHRRSGSFDSCSSRARDMCVFYCKTVPGLVPYADDVDIFCVFHSGPGASIKDHPRHDHLRLSLFHSFRFSNWIQENDKAHKHVGRLRNQSLCFDYVMVVFVQLVLILVKPQNELAIVMDFVTAQLKFNSLLATLNARSHLRRMIDCTTNDSGITNVVTQLRTGSIIQFAVQPQLQSTGSFSSDTQELGDGSIVRIE
ncbi:hypothetical protein K435DRAFT_784069, partial [Dendrothele bispora CBS 962.96]